MWCSGLVVLRSHGHLARFCAVWQLLFDWQALDVLQKGMPSPNTCRRCDAIKLSAKQGFALKMQTELERLTEESDKWKVRALAAEAKVEVNPNAN
jgi:hypothetical protein